MGLVSPVLVFLGCLNLVVAIINLMPDDDSDGRVARRVVPLLMEKQSAKLALGKTLRSLANARDLTRRWNARGWITCRRAC